MIAHVYLIRRLPARTGYFDYLCADDVSIGDLVIIPFKGRDLLGIVWNIQSSSTIKRLMSIKKIVHKSFFTKQDIDRFDALAQITAQSPSMFLQLLPFHKEQKKQKSTKEQVHKPRHYHTQDIENASNASKASSICDSMGTWPLHILHRIKESGQYLIICPNDDIAFFLQKELSRKTSCVHIHAHTSHEEVKNVYDSWKKGTAHILIGTRALTLWSPHTLKGIFLIDELHSDYDFMPRNPKYEVRFSSYLLAKQFHIPITYIGHTRSVSKEAIPHARSEHITYIDATKHPMPHPYFSLPILRALEDVYAKNKRAILFLNKKGVAMHFQCRSCGHLPTCGTCGTIPIIREHDLICPSCHTEMWHPTHCPICKRKTLSKKGIGIESIEHVLKKVFPDKHHTVVTDNLPSDTYDTFIFSEHGMRVCELQRLSNIEIVIDLCADYHFLSDHYTCDERGRYKLIRTIHLAKDTGAECFIQSHQTERIQSLLRATWESEELNIRKEYTLPPFGIEIIKKQNNDNIEIVRTIDKSVIMRYLHDFHNQKEIDTIRISPQIQAYECLTSPE